MSKRPIFGNIDSPSTKRKSLRDDLDVAKDAINTLAQQQCAMDLNGDDPLIRTTQILGCLDTTYASILALQAKLLYKKVKVQEALSTILRAINYHPTDPEVYLAAGRIYSDQGKQREVIDVCERGIYSLLPSDWVQVYEMRDLAQKQLETKVNFVSTLPVEIATYIFASIDSDEFMSTLLNCTYVSKAWRNHLLQQCPSLWGISTSSDSSKSQRPLSKISPFLTRYMQALYVYEKHNIRHNLKTLAYMIDRTEFPSIKELYIDSILKEVDRYHPLIIKLSNHLTRISIDTRAAGYHKGHDITVLPFLQLDVIMSHCSNLMHLNLRSVFNNIVYEPSDLAHPYALLELTVDTVHPEMLLEQLIPQCPRLQSLVSPGINSKILSLVNHCCPQLEQLSQCWRFYTSRPQLNDICDHDSSRLYDIACKITRSIKFESLKPFLSKSNDVLHTLQLIFEQIDGADQLAQYTFTQLKVLALDFSAKSETLPTDAIATMIRQCPLLEQILFDGNRSAIPASFLECFTVLPSLRCLFLSSFSSPTLSFENLFAHFLARNQACYLEAVSLKDCEGMTDDALGLLANIITLQAIELRYLIGLMTPTGVRAFIQKLQTLPCLRVLELDSIPHITDDLIVSLAEIDGLDSLELASLDDITSSGVYTFADHIRTLKRVEFSNCMWVDHKAEEYVNRKLLSFP